MFIVLTGVIVIAIVVVMAIVIAIVRGIAIVIVVAIDLETNLVLTFVPITSPNMLMKNIIQT